MVIFFDCLWNIGVPHVDGCTVKGSGIRGGVSELPSSFRLMIGDAFKNPVKM